MIAQMILARSVDNFLTFISEQLILIYNAKPQMLRASDQKIAWDALLGYDALEEPVAALLDRRVDALAYKGLKDLAKDLEQHIGLFSAEEDLAKGAEIVEQRNLKVHNRGIINNISVSRLSACSDRVGQQLMLSVNEVMTKALLLRLSALDLDLRASEKFSLARKRIPTEEARRTILGGWV
jgi:hypothetical protein